MSRAIPVDHAKAERIAGRALPECAKYHVRIWLDGTCVLWQESVKHGWHAPVETLIVITKNLHETNNPSDRVLSHDHEP